jgi:hypothetical protein
MFDFIGIADNYAVVRSPVLDEHEEGERWDVSRAIRAVADALVVESEKPKKDFGALVRARRKDRGLSVGPREAVLPQVRPRRGGEPPFMLSADGEEECADTYGEARLRVKIAEFRAQQAHQALEEAEASACCTTELEALEQAYLHELATYDAARQIVANLQFDHPGALTRSQPG